MSVHVLLNVLNELRKNDKMRGFAKHLIVFSTASLIYSITHEHECKILIII